MRLHRLAGVVQVVSLVVAVVAVASLLLRQPPDTMAMATAPDGAPMIDGAALYSANCAGCHGEQGEGTYAPPLAAGQATAHRGGPEAQVAFVLAGTGDMPGFRGRLTPEQVRAVVDHVDALP